MVSNLLAIVSNLLAMASIAMASMAMVSNLLAMASNLIAMASNLLAMASNLLAMASNLLAMASNLLAMASNLLAMASNLLGMASNLIAMASNLLAMASNLLAMASNLLAMASNLLAMASNWGVDLLKGKLQLSSPHFSRRSWSERPRHDHLSKTWRQFQDDSECELTTTVLVCSVVWEESVKWRIYVRSLSPVFERRPLPLTHTGSGQSLPSHILGDIKIIKSIFLSLCLRAFVANTWALPSKIHH